MIRALSIAALAFGLGLTSTLAFAQQRPAAAARAGDRQAIEHGRFGDWVVYSTTEGRNKVCYIHSEPKSREPRTLNRDPGHIFISSRPAERVRNEISFVLGFPTDEKKPGRATMGQTSFALSPKARNAWMSNAAEENSFIETARRNQTLTVSATSGRGNLSTDRYSLNGFGQAMDRMRRECP